MLGRMSARLASTRRALLLLGLVTSVPAAGPAAAQDAAGDAEERPDFTGVYVFNPERSDDLRRLVEESVGPAYTQGDAKQEVVRVWIRRWLMGVLEDPESRYLTIEQTVRDFKSGVGDEVSIYYFGREASSAGPGREPLKVTVSWQGSQLVTEEKSEDGGRIVSLYTLLPGNETLIVAYLLEHKTLKKPLEARMFFDRMHDED